MFEEFQHEGYAEHPLEDGDTLRIAGYEFRVEFEPAPPCAAAEPARSRKTLVLQLRVVLGIRLSKQERGSDALPLLIFRRQVPAQDLQSDQGQ